MTENKKNTTEKLDVFIEKALENYDLPGLGIGVFKGSGSKQEGSCEEYEYSKTVGYKNYLDKTPLKSTDIFHMASITKLLVGTSIMQLFLQGALDIDDKLIDFLPWFKMADERYEEITLRQLLSHTSGMPDVKNYRWDAPETDEDALERYAKSDEVRLARLLWGPSESRFSYSNIGYEILGVVVAQVSGMSVEEYIKRNIFVPLGMNNSTLLTFERDMSQVCSPHGKDAEKHIIIESHFPYNRAHAASSTFTSNLEDLKKFAKGIFAIAFDRDNELPQILAPEILEAAWEETALVPNNGEHIGLSWFKREQKIADSKGVKVTYILYGHEGTDDGFRASFWICPQMEIAITVVSNISNAPVKKISKQVFELLTS